MRVLAGASKPCAQRVINQLVRPRALTLLVHGRMGLMAKPDMMSEGPSLTYIALRTTS